MRALLIIATALLASTSVEARPPCTSAKSLISQLEDNYREQLVGEGVSGNGLIVRVYVSEEGTFSVISINVHGIACMVAAGKNFEHIKPKPGDET